MRKILLLICALLIAAACGEEELASQLASLGYTGEDALTNFQLANGLTVTGVADKATLNRLNGENAVTKREYIADCLSLTRYSQTVDYKSSHADVRHLQSLLRALGYYDNPTNSGVYDVATQTAVALFQKVNSLPVLDCANSATLSRLVSPAAIPAEGYREIYTLSLGSEGMYVKEMQTALAELGYFTGECSGVFGYQSQKAVLAFQKANALEETGVWSLYQQLLTVYGLCVCKSDSEAFSGSEILKCGDKGTDVCALEIALAALNYFSGTPDEFFDEETALAVRVYQEANGFEPDSEADSSLRTLLIAGKGVSYNDFCAVEATRQLDYGDNGYAVYLCAKHLAALGYPIGEKWVYDEEIAALMEVFNRAEGFGSGDSASEAALFLLTSGEAMPYEQALELSSAQYSRDLALSRFNALMECAESCVGKPYEAGSTGPDSFSMSGFICCCFQQASVEVQPTVAMQLEEAYRMSGFTTDPSEIAAGQQVFFRKGETVYTGICTAENRLICAMPERGYVVEMTLREVTESYEYIGAIAYL